MTKTKGLTNHTLTSGPPHQIIKSMKDLNTSIALFWTTISGEHEYVIDDQFPVFTDVRDVAAAHVLAVEKDEAKNQRYCLVAEKFQMNDRESALTVCRPLG